VLECWIFYDISIIDQVECVSKLQIKNAIILNTRLKIKIPILKNRVENTNCVVTFKFYTTLIILKLTKLNINCVDGQHKKWWCRLNDPMIRQDNIIITEKSLVKYVLTHLTHS